MTSSVFVCHAKSDIEATSEIIDLLETAMEFPQGALSSSSLPGYSSDVRSEVELHSMLASAAVVLVLVTERSVTDTAFCFELGAAWSLGIRIVPLLTGTASITDLPWPLLTTPPVRPHDRQAWATLLHDLAGQLGVRMRVASEARIALDEIATSKSIEPPAPKRMRVGPPTLPGASKPIEPPLDPMLTSQVQSLASSTPRLSCAAALEAGRALSDCVFNRDEELDFASELELPFGRFILALGGDWQSLRNLQDFDLWLGVTENLLHSLPVTQHHLGSWYALGYELSTLHNIANRAATGTAQERDEVEAVWQETLERFLANAEAVGMRYEELAGVLAWLENLVGPVAERDFTHVARSLDALRSQASATDRLHSAA